VFDLNLKKVGSKAGPIVRRRETKKKGGLRGPLEYPKAKGDEARLLGQKREEGMTYL